MRSSFGELSRTRRVDMNVTVYLPSLHYICMRTLLPPVLGLDDHDMTMDAFAVMNDFVMTYL